MDRSFSVLVSTFTYAVVLLVRARLVSKSAPKRAVRALR